MFFCFIGICFRAWRKTISAGIRERRIMDGDQSAIAFCFGWTEIKYNGNLLKRKHTRITTNWGKSKVGKLPRTPWIDEIRRRLKFSLIKPRDTFTKRRLVKSKNKMIPKVKFWSSHRPLFWPYSFRLDADKEAEKSGVVEENVWNGTVTTETGGKFSVNL